MDNSKRSTYIIAAISLLVIVAAVYFLFIFQKSPKKVKIDEGLDNVKTVEELEVSKRPFVTLTPTSNGAEIIISIEKMGEFDKIEYELTYLADNPQIPGQKIERGATGTDVNTRDQKYKKSMLLGTASKGVRSPDKGIEGGKLTLHMFDGDTEYKSVTAWDLIEAGQTKGEIEEQNGKLTWSIPALGQNYWIIIADTVGLPAKDGGFDTKNLILPVFGTFSVAPKFASPGTVTIKVNSDSQDLSLYSYNHQDETWQKVNSKYDSAAKTVSATTGTFSTYVVVSSK